MSEILENEDKKISGKGLMDLIKEDKSLSRKINYEEAVCMNPSIEPDLEKREAILKKMREKYPEREIDEGLEEAYNSYLESINNSKETENENVSLSKKL